MVAIFENIILRNAMWNTKQRVENILHDVKEFLCDMQWNLVKCLKKAVEGIISLKYKVGELCGGVFVCFPSVCIPFLSLVPCPNCSIKQLALQLCNVLKTFIICTKL